MYHYWTRTYILTKLKFERPFVTEKGKLITERAINLFLQYVKDVMKPVEFQRSVANNGEVGRTKKTDESKEIMRKYVETLYSLRLGTYPPYAYFI